MTTADQLPMAEHSKIEWTDHTFNPWVGCTKISPACNNCYAERWAKRTGDPELWAGRRRRTTPANWRKPLKWNDADYGRRQRVFCASLADVFDNEIPRSWRSDLFRLIDDTPNLDWLLLTKRIGNVQSMIEASYLRNQLPDNVWLGITVVTQAEAERDIPKLVKIPARVRFLSCEPLIEGISLSHVRGNGEGIDWLIVGGESGPNARPMQENWCTGLMRQCDARDIAFFMKQGSQANWPHWKDFDRWSDEIQVREFPDKGEAYERYRQWESDEAIREDMSDD